MKTLLLANSDLGSRPFMIGATVKKTDLIATLALIGPRSNINPLQSSLEASRVLWRGVTRSVAQRGCESFYVACAEAMLVTFRAGRKQWIAR